MLWRKWHCHLHGSSCHRKQQLRLFQGSKTTSTSYTDSAKGRVWLPTESQDSPAEYIREMCFITNNHKNLGSNQQKALIFHSHIYELTGIWLAMETECGWAWFQPVGWVLSSPTSRLHWKGTFLRCVLSMAKVGAQNGKPHLVCVFQTRAHNSSENLPLAKANHLAHSRVKGQESTPPYQEVA